MWTPTTRRQHSRDDLRYETDVTDAEWAVIAPLLPPPRERGRPRTCLRAVVNAIFYLLRGGITWRLLPTDLPPRSTVFGWFSLWRDTGVFETMNHLLVMADRERVGREASHSSRPRSTRFLIWLMAYLIGLWWDPQSIPSITGARWANTRNKTALASQIRATVLHIRHTPPDCGPQCSPSNLMVCYDGLLTTFSRSERGQPARGRPVRGHPERGRGGKVPP